MYACMYACIHVRVSGDDGPLKITTYHAKWLPDMLTTTLSRSLSTSSVHLHGSVRQVTRYSHMAGLMTRYSPMARLMTRYSHMARLMTRYSHMARLMTRYSHMARLMTRYSHMARLMTRYSHMARLMTRYSHILKASLP